MSEIQPVSSSPQSAPSAPAQSSSPSQSSGVSQGSGASAPSNSSEPGSTPAPQAAGDRSTIDCDPEERAAQSPESSSFQQLKSSLNDLQKPEEKAKASEKTSADIKEKSDGMRKELENIPEWKNLSADQQDKYLGILGDLDSTFQNEIDQIFQKNPPEIPENLPDSYEMQAMKYLKDNLPEDSRKNMMNSIKNSNGSEQSKEGILGRFMSQLPDDAKDGLVSQLKNSIHDDIAGDAKTLVQDGRIDDSVLNGLEKLNSPSLNPRDGIDQTELLSNALHDIAAPQDISQMDKGTCAATSVQRALAERNPARYLDVLGSLASKDGKPTDLVPSDEKNFGLHTLWDVPLNTDRAENNMNDGRTLSTRLMSPAIMDLADNVSPNSPVNDDEKRDFSYDSYSNRFDSHTGGGSGLTPPQIEYAYEKLLGDNATVLKPSATLNKDQMVTQLQDALNNGQDVLVGMMWGPGGHRVSLEGIGTDEQDGQQYAYIGNPWGGDDGRARVPMDEFKKHLTNALVSDNAATPLPRPAAYTDWAEYGLLDHRTYASPGIDDPPQTGQ